MRPNITISGVSDKYILHLQKFIRIVDDAMLPKILGDMVERTEEDKKEFFI
jgi:hypothetical protein